MILALRRSALYCCATIASFGLIACAGDPLQSGVDPFALSVFKEGLTAMPLNPPNKASLVPFYVSRDTIFKFAVDTNSILIGADGVTRYIVVLTNPSGGEQAQYEGIRCDSFEWRIYGTFENSAWRENPLSTWKDIQNNIPNRYQASLAKGAFCNLNMQERDIKTIVKELDPASFIGGSKPTNSYGVQY